MPTVVEDRHQRAREFDQRVGRNLKDMRDIAGVSQAWLAEMADMSQSALSRVERGERTLTFQQGVIICKILQIQPDDLIFSLEE